MSVLCKRDLPEYAQPVTYIFLDALPKIAAGKVGYCGVFAVELPEDMPSGTYTYLLYLFVHDEYCEARIPFTW